MIQQTAITEDSAKELPTTGTRALAAFGLEVAAAPAKTEADPPWLDLTLAGGLEAT